MRLSCGRVIIKLEHDIVGQQDIRRVIDDALAPLVFYLPGITFEGDRLLTLGKAITEELLQLFKLAVNERIHRINDDCLNALSAAASQNMVDDGHDIGETLARTGAGGENVIMTALGDFYGAALMLVEGTGDATILLVVQEDPFAPWSR